MRSEKAPTSTWTLARAGIWSLYPARTRLGRGPILPAAIAVTVLVLLWWAVTAGGVIDRLYLPNPVDVLSTMVHQACSGIMWHYLLPTLTAALLGTLIAVGVAIPLGVLITHSRVCAAILEPLVSLSQTVPLVAIAPLLVLWIGYGTIPIALLCAIVAFFPMATTTVVGLRQLDMRAVDHAVLDGASWWQLLYYIEAPMAGPAILAGIRSGVVLSMTGAVVGEFVMGGTGLGTLLTLSRQTADTAAVFAAIGWISLVAMTLHFLVQLIERAAAATLQGENI